MEKINKTGRMDQERGEVKRELGRTAIQQGIKATDGGERAFTS
jgi:hypothetical protein